MDRGPGRQADKLHLQEYHPGQQGPPRSPCLTGCFPRKPPRNAQGETKRQREEGKVVGLGIEDGQRERGSLKEGFLGLRHRSGEQGRCMSRSAGRMGTLPTGWLQPPHRPPPGLGLCTVTVYYTAQIATPKAGGYSQAHSHFQGRSPLATKRPGCRSTHPQRPEAEEVTLGRHLK